jgi:hypothetical protein
MIAFGDRIQKPGNERLTLTGTVTDSQKKVTSATLVWEVSWFSVKWRSRVLR